MNTMPLPTLYLSHGSPMTALEPREAGAFMERLGPAIEREFGRPKAILAVSAHSLTREPVLLAAPRHEAVYDFGGFDPKLHTLRYDAPGAPELAQRVALACDMPERRADLVKVAALLQDLGTLGVPAHVLSKPDILTIEEMGTVQMHPTYARDILSEVPGLGAPAWWVGCHHERVDGKGYPGMLEGDEVPVEAQVIGMCEAFDALTSDRPYRKAMSRADAVEVLRGLSGTRFDERVLESFEAAEGPFTTP